MDKAEKIKRIKELQGEIAELVKQQKFDDALIKMDEILKLAPNLQKIKDLKAKIGKKAEQLKKAEAKAVEIPSEKKVPEPESKKEASPETSPDEETSDASLEHMEALLKEEESVPSGSQEGKKIAEEQLEQAEKPEEKQEKPVQETVQETPGLNAKKTSTEVPEKSDKNEAVETVDEEQKLKEVEELLKEEMTKEEAKEELDELLGEQEKVREILEETHEEVKAEPETIEDIELDALLGEEEVGSQEPSEKEKEENDTQEDLEDLKPEIDFSRIMDQAMEEEGESETEEEFKLDGSELKLDLEVKEEPETQETETETSAPAKDEEKVLTKEEVDKKLKELLNKKEETAKPAEQEAKEETDSYTVDYTAGIPTVKGGKKKEKLDYDFKISDEPEVKGGKEAVTSPYEQMAKPSLEKTFDAASKTGFRLSLIPQAMGFALNLERMLYLTLGIFVSVVIGKFLMMFVPQPYGFAASVLISGSIQMFFLTFIAYTIVLQMKQHVYGNFRQFFGTFAAQCGSSAASYWFIYFVALIVVSLATGILMALLKLGDFGAILYGILSLPSLIFLVLFVLLLLASPLLSFIVPALIAVDKPGVLETFYESVRLLKNHLFTVIGGYLYSLLLSVFLSVILFFVYAFGLALLVFGGFIIGGQAFLKMLQSIPPGVFQPVSFVMNALHLPYQIPLGMSQSEQSIAGFLFMVMLFIGISFLFTIPVIFINGGGVITYLSLKERLDIHKDV